MLKLIGIGLISVLVLVIALTIFAIAGILPTNFWLAIVLPIIVFFLFFLISFVLAAFNQINSENVGKVVTFLVGGLTGATITNATDWVNVTIKFFNQQSVTPVFIYVGGTCVLFGLVGLALGLLSGRQSIPNIQAAGVNTITNLVSMMLPFR